MLELLRYQILTRLLSVYLLHTLILSDTVRLSMTVFQQAAKVEQIFFTN